MQLLKSYAFTVLSDVLLPKKLNLDNPITVWSLITVLIFLKAISL